MVLKKREKWISKIRNEMKKIEKKIETLLSLGACGPGPRAHGFEKSSSIFLQNIHGSENSQKKVH